MNCLNECRVPFGSDVITSEERMLLPNMPTDKHPGRKAYGGKTKSKKYKTAVDDKPYAMNDNRRHPFNVITTTTTVATIANVADVRKPRGAESIKDHQTQKPIALMQWLISLASNPNEIVLDCFGGTGTTGVAAILSGRIPILIEREPEYVKLIKQRIDDV